jgi:hypothetical protein
MATAVVLVPEVIARMATLKMSPAEVVTAAGAKVGRTLPADPAQGGAVVALRVEEAMAVMTGHKTKTSLLTK